VPVTAAEGDYSYILDMVSTSDSTHFESVEAVVRVNPPPGPDLVIDGSGAFEIAAAGTGGGGSAIAFGGPGELLTVNLDVYNRGLVADSFRVSWNTPAGWPAGSVLLRDVGINYPSPFVTPLLAPGASASYSLIVLVPAGADLRNRIIVDAFSLSGLLEDSALLEVVTAAYVRGRVFDDADHDGTPDPGEGGWSGVQVTLDDPAGPVTAMTGVGGWYTIEMEPGAARNVFSGTLSGMFSITPDTVSTGLTAAGDTVHIDFGDVMMSDISPDMAASGPAGGVITAAHTIVAGTAGQAALSVSLPAGWTEEWYRDVNSDGVLDPPDTRLTAADLDLDPAVPGRDVVPVIMCVYVPAGTPAGTEAVVQVRLDQNLSGTPLVTSSSAADRLTVLASASGMLRLVKQVDLDHARPGDVVTYTIIFSNPGTDDVMQIEITDPVSPDVDLVTGSFGPGADIEWVRGGSSVYLTADPADADEALYDPSTGVLRVILSRQAPYSLAPGEEGRIIYRVRIR
jgi:uncharacterized repeat protein (TIGR01451 family)